MFVCLWAEQGLCINVRFIHTVWPLMQFGCHYKYELICIELLNWMLIYRTAFLDDKKKFDPPIHLHNCYNFPIFFPFVVAFPHCPYKNDILLHSNASTLSVCKLQPLRWLKTEWTINYLTTTKKPHYCCTKCSFSFCLCL